MSQEKTYSYADVEAHSSKQDLWMVIGDKVYAVQAFLDEHPGGEEVLMDVAGKDATDAFEDVGHSDEARELLAGLCVGNLEKSAKSATVTKVSKPQSSTIINPTSAASLLPMLLVVVVGVAFAAFRYYQGPKSA